MLANSVSAQACPRRSGHPLAWDIDALTVALPRGSEVSAAATAASRGWFGGLLVRRASEPAGDFQSIAPGLSAGVRSPAGERAWICARGQIDWERGPHGIAPTNANLDATNVTLDVALGARAFAWREHALAVEVGISTTERHAVYRRGEGSTLPPTRERMRIRSPRVLLVLQLDSAYSITLGIARRNGVPFTRAAPIAYSDGDAALILGARYRLWR